MARSKHVSLPDGYSLEVVKDGSVVIRLPLRLSKRSHDSIFVCEPLDTLLACHASALPRFRECTIEFLHCYSASHHPADVRDHDNLETRAVLNVIERYLLTHLLLQHPDKLLGSERSDGDPDPARQDPGL